MPFKKIALFVLLPLALSACDSNQPSYSASGAASAPPPPPPAQTQPPAPAPAPAPAPEPVASEPATPPAAVAQAAPHPAPAPFQSAKRYSAPPAGKMVDVAKIGVGGCDQYIERYRTCFNATDIPHGEKFEVRRTLMQQVRKWKSDVAAGKISEVAVECTDAERAARAKFADLGCKTF